MASAAEGHSFMVVPSVAVPAAPVTPTATAAAIHAHAPRTRPAGKVRASVRSRKKAAIAAVTAMQNATWRGSVNACARPRNGRSPSGLWKVWICAGAMSQPRRSFSRAQALYQW
jgi:hypothetical protein